MLKKIVKALAAAALVGAASTASAGVLFNLNTGNIAGSTTNFNFAADEITITSVGNAVIAVTDNGDGSLGPGFLDTYLENGAVSAVNFQNNNVNVPLLQSGINLGYEMYAVYQLIGPVGIVGTNVVAPIVTATATIYYDEVINSALDLATAVPIATLTIPAGTGDCTLTAASSFADGACKITMAFNAVGGNVWSWNGTDLDTIATASMTLDINVDNLVSTTAGAPALPALLPGQTTSFTADHDGSAVLNIPEPGALALLGIAALGGFAVSRRKA